MILGCLVALTLIVAAGEHKWTQLVFPVWVLVVSVVILVTRPTREVAAEQTESPS